MLGYLPATIHQAVFCSWGVDIHMFEWSHSVAHANLIECVFLDGPVFVPIFYCAVLDVEQLLAREVRLHMWLQGILERH